MDGEGEWGMMGCWEIKRPPIMLKCAVQMLYVVLQRSFYFTQEHFCDTSPFFCSIIGEVQVFPINFGSAKRHFWYHSCNVYPWPL